MRFGDYTCECACVVAVSWQRSAPVGHNPTVEGVYVGMLMLAMWVITDRRFAQAGPNVLRI